MTATELLSRIFRTQPEYDIVVADRLTAAEIRAAGSLMHSPELFGVLRARGEGQRRPTRAIDGETALLLFTLREAGPLPAFARARLEGQEPRSLWRMIADGILEVEIEGAFCSGQQALERLGSAAAGEVRQGRIARLSREALSSAAALPGGSIGRRAFHLYAAGRLPVTRRWRERFPDGDAVLAFLGSGLGGRGASLLASSWTSSHRDGRWLHWRSTRGDVPVPRTGAATYKLYVSPAVDALPAAWGAALEGLTGAGAFELKVGVGAAGLLRPDKLVAYFADRAKLAVAAEDLAALLAGVPPHGVPFTAEIAGEGLFSWGLDPLAGARFGPEEDVPEEWRAAAGFAESWRAWLCRELARGLVSAGEQGEASAEAARFTLARVRLLGVDPESWSATEPLERELGGQG